MSADHQCVSDNCISLFDFVKKHHKYSDQRAQIQDIQSKLEALDQLYGSSTLGIGLFCFRSCDLDL